MSEEEAARQARRVQDGPGLDSPLRAGGKRWGKQCQFMFQATSEVSLRRRKMT